MLTQWRSFIIVAAALGLGAGRLSADPAVDRPLQPASPIEAVIPMDLRGLLLNQPVVSFLVSVDEHGKLVEFMPIAAPHYKLLEAAEKHLLEAKFEPATKDGKPVGSTGWVTVNFFDPGQRAFFQGLIDTPPAGNAGDLADRRIYEMTKDRYVFRRAKPSELDHPVEVKETEVILYTDKAGQAARGHCMVEFWIDPAGEVKFPRVLQSDNEAVATSALLTLRKTKFAPPTLKGRPTYVQVRQPMDFDTGAPAASAPAQS